MKKSTEILDQMISYALLCKDQNNKNEILKTKEFKIKDNIKGLISVNGNIDRSNSSAHMTIGFKATGL